MTATLEKALGEALEDEYRARATYRAVLDAFGDVRPFSNIVESEGRHIEALSQLYAKYDLQMPTDRWAGEITAPASVEEACRAGVRAERENRAMYDRLLPEVRSYPDVVGTFERLCSASQERHLPAFERCLDREEGRLRMGRGSGRGTGRGGGRRGGRCSGAS